MWSSTRTVPRGTSFSKRFQRPRRAVEVVQSTTAALPVADLLERKGVSLTKARITVRIADDKPVLVASADIAAGESILTVPDSLWVTPSTAKKDATLTKHISQLEPWVQVAILLLKERGNPKFDIAGYLQNLPSEVDTPLFWTKDELSQLQGSQMLESATGYRQFFEERFQQLESSIFAVDRSTFPAASFNLSSFMWAAGTIRSRVHAPLEGDDIALVPGADLVSHRRDGAVEWRVGRGGFLGRSRQLELVAVRAVRQGEELAMDYGVDKLDGTILLDYGVMDNATPQAGYYLTLTLEESQKWFADKADVLEVNGMTPSRTFTLRPDGQPDPELLAFMRLLQLRRADTFLLEPIFRNEAWAHMMDPVSEENEADTCKAMCEGASEALALYPTTIRQDLDLLTAGKLRRGSREEAAVLVRLGEKESLDACLRYFEARAANIKDLTYYQERRLKRLGLLDDRGKSTWDGFFKDGMA